MHIHEFIALPSPNINEGEKETEARQGSSPVLEVRIRFGINRSEFQFLICFSSCVTLGNLVNFSCLLRLIHKL